MSKSSGRPEQLHLQLQWDYLKQLLSASEELASYEATALAFLGEGLSSVEKHPVWDELNRIQ